MGALEGVDGGGGGGWRVIGFVRERGEEKRTEWRWSSWIDGHQKSITDLNRIDGLDGVARRGAGGRERGEEDAPRGGSKAGEKEKERKEGRLLWNRLGRY